MKVRELLIALVCGASTQAAERPHAVSLVSLLASPSQYEGVDVVVTGYLCRAETTQLSLFLTHADCEAANYANAIGVTEPSKALPNLPALLVVEGQFEDRSGRIFVDEVFVWGQIRTKNISGRSLN